MSKRILFCGEASFLNTGYAKYTKEVVSRLHSAGYTVAELGVYCSDDDPRQNHAPWKIYPNIPAKTDKKAIEQYLSQGMSQFGNYRFEQICLDFKPDVVCDIRDHWMMEFEELSPFRKHYNLVWMPTVDAEPQSDQWLSSFANLDGLLTYSDWGANLLRKYGLKVFGTASPSASEYFCPLDKVEVRRAFGLDENLFIVGTVMRNQVRKLFPDLFKSFRTFLDETKSKNSFLYCHTCYPDIGWDIPQLLKENMVASKVLFTYACKTCGCVFPSVFSDAICNCPKCGNFAASMSNVQNGVSDKILSYIYNTFDIYVQYANSEGFGVPQVEAAACGIPLIVVDYSAMNDGVTRLNAFGVKPLGLRKETETGCNRALPDNSMFVAYLKECFSNKAGLFTKGQLTRQKYEENFGWDKTVKVWMDCINSLPDKANWNSPPNIINPSAYDEHSSMSNRQYAQWLITNVLCEPERLGSYMELRNTRDLNNGVTSGGSLGMYFNESSFGVGKPTHQPFSREKAYEHFCNLRARANYWENKRCS